MKKLFVLLLVTIPLIIQAQQPVIIDHTFDDLSEIPLNWIDSAKAKLFIGYGHTSHGSQIISGMDAIESYYTEGTYNWSHSGGEGELHLFEGSSYNDGYLDHDVGYSGWDDLTRTYLDSFPECNVIIWSWCGQVNDVDLETHYFQRMEALEEAYPEVKFVYMTGHLEGGGPEGSLFQANQKIREYCDSNNKILFDFTDIEKYSPDADTNYQEYYVNDACDYQLPQGGTANWANNWLEKNPDHLLTEISALCGGCAHSVSLNCLKKGIAAWYLWAILAGWEYNGISIEDTTTSPSDTSSNIDSNQAYIQLTNFSDEISIYPVPFKNELYIEFNYESNKVAIEILNLYGKLLYKNSYKNLGGVICLSDLELQKGIYLLNIKSEQKTYCIKIIR